MGTSHSAPSFFRPERDTAPFEHYSFSPEQELHIHSMRHIAQEVTQHLGLHRLEAWILESNHASMHLFASLGFQQEAVLRERYWTHGKHNNTHVYAWVPGKK